MYMYVSTYLLTYIYIYMDLSKAFDCLPHNLLLAKLKAYGLTDHSINLLRNYLSNR